MNGGEKSDPSIVAAKPVNEAGRPAEERVERRGGAEGNAGGQSMFRTQGRGGMSPALDRVRKAARPREDFVEPRDVTVSPVCQDHKLSVIVPELSQPHGH